MARYFIQDYTLSNIADAIREKANINAFIKPTQMPSYIRNNMLSNGDLDCVLNREITEIHNSTCTYLGTYAFAGCTNLSILDMPNVSMASANALLSVKPTHVSLGVLSLTVGDNVVLALSGNTSLQTLNLPSCSQILSSAVQGATGLVSVSIPNVTDITQSAFYGCTSLTEISVPLLGISNDYGVGANAFAGCTALEKIYMPNILSTNKYAFSKCTSLKEIYMPKLAGVHASGAFPNVTTVESATIGFATIPNWSTLWPNLKYFSDSVATAITSNAFYGCGSLSQGSFYAPGLVTLTQNAFRATGFTSVNHTTFPNVTALASAYIFYQCTSLKSVNMSKVTGTLGNRVFSGCTNLTYVSLPGVTSVYVSSNYLPLLECPNLVSANFNGLTVIPNYLFSAKTALKTVSINAATTINTQAFLGCTALASISLPAVTKLISSCFKNCTALSVARLGSSANTTAIAIQSQAFYGCTSLASLYIYNTSALATVNNSNAFTSTPIASGTGYIYVPATLYASYLTATNWSLFSAQIKSIAGI